jgi:hypothetical protein
MRSKKAVAHQAIKVVVLIALLFIGFWVMLKPFAMIFTEFTDTTELTAQYPAEAQCEGKGYYWYDSACHEVPERAESVMFRTRSTWLALPIIVVIGLVIWLFVAASKNDYERYNIQ